MGMAATKQEAFWEACGFGNKDEVEMYIAMGIDVNWKSYTHNSCAIHVASQGKKEIVQMLLDANCDVNARDDRDNLALHHAAMKGHGDIIKMLVKAGSHIDAQDKNGWSSLINAAYWCQPEAVKALIDSGCNPHLTNGAGRTALHELCRSNSTDEVKLAEIADVLIEANLKIDAKCSDLGEADFTPLMFCAYHNHPKVAERLIKAGCEINAQGTNGWTALHWATDRNHKAVITVLLNNGIDATLKGRRDDTALDRCLDNSVRQILSSAMGVTYQPLEGMELKLRREALEAERKARFMPDLGPLSLDVPQGNGQDVMGTGPHSPGIVMSGSAMKDSTVLQAMQEQMKQAQSQLRTRRLQRQRSMPTSLFRPPSPPKIPEPLPAPAAPQKPVSALDPDSIDFIDSEDEDEIENAENGNGKNPANGKTPVTDTNVTQNGAGAGAGDAVPTITKEPTPEKTLVASTTVLDDGLVVPVLMESRGYVTTDEGESDSETEDSAATPGKQDTRSCSSVDGMEGMEGVENSGLNRNTAENSMENMTENSTENSIKNSTENSMKNTTENSMEIPKHSMEISDLSEHSAAYEADMSGDDEYIDEDEMGGGFEEGIPA